MNTIVEIEDIMAEIMLHPAYMTVEAEYERLLAIMGNVDGNEVVALVLVALVNTDCKTLI